LSCGQKSQLCLLYKSPKSKELQLKIKNLTKQMFTKLITIALLGCTVEGLTLRQKMIVNNAKALAQTR